jgi:hypothetical protein
MSFESLYQKIDENIKHKKHVRTIVEKAEGVAKTKDQKIATDALLAAIDDTLRILVEIRTEVEDFEKSVLKP